MQNNNNSLPRKNNGTFDSAILHPDPLFAAEGLSYTIIQRFLEKVHKTTFCWIWTGAVDEKGYGVIGRAGKTSGIIRARRLSWLMHFAEAPPLNRKILATCKNNSCVNPQHLAFRKGDSLPRLRPTPPIILPEDVADLSYVTQDPTLPPGFSNTFRERFFKKVDKTSSPNGCWLWVGCLNKSGYGHIGKGWNQHGNLIGAHMASWIIHKGQIPKGMAVCHNCPGGDNPSCVNPAHLWLGTNRENMIDAVRKQKAVGPHWNARLKLPPDERENLRGEFAQGNVTKAALARKYKISPGSVQRIVGCVTYADYFRMYVSGAGIPITRTGSDHCSSTRLLAPF